MKTGIFVAVLCFGAINFLTQPKDSSTKNETPATRNTPTLAPPNSDHKSASATEATKSSPPHWYTSSEWWLVIIAALTGFAIAYQAREMVKTTEIIGKQADLMKSQTDILVEYNKATRDSADATAKSAAATERTVGLLEKQANLMEGQLEEMRASTDAAINRDRGRVHIVVSNPDEYKFRYGHKHFDVAFMLSSSGATKVFADDFRTMFTKTENADITPDYAQCVQFESGGKVIPKADCAPHQVIGARPDGMLTSEEIEKIQRGELFLHFDGFARFRVFERRRRRNIHLRWDGIPESEVTEWHWQQVGAPEENAEFEEKEDNQPN